MPRLHLLLWALLPACGGTISGGSDGGDASHDACVKCGRVDSGLWGDGSIGFADAGVDVIVPPPCPADPPIPPQLAGCGTTSPECDYTIQADSGQDISVTCKCVPQGEDMLAYQCAEPYSLCMSTSGAIDPALKACQSDGDCQMERQQTDCCDSQLWVGVNQSSYFQLQMCEVSWATQFQPPCNCAATGKTEDGNSTSLYGQGSSVHCVPTANGNQCMTSTP